MIDSNSHLKLVPSDSHEDLKAVTDPEVSDKHIQ